MDKLAQRFNAQEIIKANSQAEAQEIGRLREHLRAYDDCLQEMRKLNLKNVETAEKAQLLTKKADAMKSHYIRFKTKLFNIYKNEKRADLEIINH